MLSNHDPQPYDQLMQRLNRVPKQIAQGGSVQRVQSYKEWVKRATKVLSNKRATRADLIPLINDYDVWDR